MKMKKLIPLLSITLPLLAFANPTTSTQTLKEKSVNRILPKITVILESQFATNIDGLTEPFNRNTISYKMKARTKIKGKPFKKAIILYLPLLETELAPSLDKTLKTLRSTNSIIGLYFPKGGPIFNTLLNLDYNDSYGFNDEGVLENLRYLNYGIGGGVGYSFKNGLGFDYEIKTKLNDYLKPLSNSEATENDSLKFETNFKPKFKVNKYTKFELDLKYSKKLFKEKRALLENGAEDGAQAETIDQYQANLSSKIQLKSIVLNPSFGYRFNKDMENNGKTYKGPQAGFSLGLIGKKMGLSARINYKRRQYQSQQIDTTLPLGESEKLKMDIINLRNHFTFKLNKVSTLSLGYDLTLTDSNSPLEENTNHIFKLGLNLTI